ncbi:bifunctional precorrin-2 dehydrogenase/sirohydrochlorin ferrochelatase [uncultured Ruthenibacterium sp.]|uniref:precorrin-2 dehydrogenase/sirohydrochlorin ferrochelatase family protein n=1 Tax=uncultured Ruthenibacterium sp. TaxID=1905347 RepID=UPI00349EE1D7
MPYFPLFVPLAQRDVLIVGGGAVALRKAHSLAPFGCRITAVAATFCQGWEEVDARRITAVLQGDEPMLWDRPWALVIAASGDRALNHAVSRLAQDKGIPVNAVDDKDACTFYFPALVRRGEMVVGLCGAGKAPFYTRALRKELEKAIPARDGAVLNALESQRPAVRSQGQKAAEALIEVLREALDKDPELTRAQLEALCADFWAGRAQ